MVNNYDRIYREIEIAAQRESENMGVDPEDLQCLILEIVDTVDRHRMGRLFAIKKDVRALVERAADTFMTEGTVRD